MLVEKSLSKMRTRVVKKIKSSQRRAKIKPNTQQQNQTWSTAISAAKNRKYKANPPEHLNTEQVWRRSIAETFKEYLENCSMSGFRYLVDSSKTRLEKWVWCIVILASIISLAYVVVLMDQEASLKPVLVSLENTRYHIRNVAFPAVAICNVNRISKAAANKYASWLFSRDNVTYSRQDLYRLVLMLGRLHDYDIDGYEELISFETFLHAVDRPFNVDARLLELSPSCNESFLRCKFREGVRECGELFQTRRTQNGYCCVFNYHHVIAESLGVKDADPGDDVRRTVPLPGYKYGLSAILDPHLEDYAYPLHSTTGFDVKMQVLIFDPYDYPDQSGGGLVHRILTPRLSTFLNLRASTAYSTPPVKRYSIKERGCRFSDEHQGSMTGHYSYSNCIVRCRIRALVRLCKCVPFFLPSDNAPSCTLENLACLNKYKQKMLFLFPPVELDGLEIEREDSLLCPECFPDCTSTRYTVTTTDAELQLKPDHRVDWTSNVNLTNKSILYIYYADVDTDLYKMDVLFYWFETISNIGGLCGFFVGFSLIGVAEFNYYLTIRFTYILKRNRRKYQLNGQKKNLWRGCF